MSRRLFSRLIPPEKNINPRIASAHGFRSTIFSPKIPSTPIVSATNPVRVNKRAMAFIISLRVILIEKINGQRSGKAADDIP